MAMVSCPTYGNGSHVAQPLQTGGDLQQHIFSMNGLPLVWARFYAAELMSAAIL